MKVLITAIALTILTFSGCDVVFAEPPENQLRVMVGIEFMADMEEFAETVEAFVNDFYIEGKIKILMGANGTIFYYTPPEKAPEEKTGI